MDIAVKTVRFCRPSLWAGAEREARVAFARQRLCLGPKHDAEIDRLLPSTADRELVTLWWDRN